MGTRTVSQRLKLDGPWQCPACRTEVAPVPSGQSPPRCARDGRAYVPKSAIEMGADPLLGTVVGGRFVVLGRLGWGSMGTVYRARQEGMGRDVAIKILRSERAFDALAKARFAREAKALSLLTSPNTVTVYDFGEIPEAGGETSLYLAMELLEGESLGARLKRAGRMSAPIAVEVAAQALRSLDEAHQKGVVHRDLKPDNLFLFGTREDGVPHCKVLDFGIAKILGEGGRVDALETQAGTVFGTPRYMSPEQAQGKALDARSDLYALGVLLFQMLAGKPPFTDDDAVVVMARHIKTVPPRVDQAAPDAEIPAAIADVVAAALSKSPDERPQTAREFIERLHASLGAPTPAGAPSASAPSAASGEVSGLVQDDLDGVAPSRAAKASRRGLWLLAGLAAAGIAGGALALRGGPPASEAKPAGNLVRARARALALGREAETAPPSTAASPPAPPPAPDPSAAPQASASAPAPKPQAPAQPGAKPGKVPPSKGYVMFD